MNNSGPTRTGLDAIKDADWRVRKIGGTAAGRLKQNADIAEEGKQIIVTSAIRGGKEYDELRHPDVHDFDTDGNEKAGFNTTSHLIALGSALREGNKGKAHDLITRIERFTLGLVGTEVAADEKITEKGITHAQMDGMVRYHTETIRRIINRCSPDDLVRIGNDWLVKTKDTYYSITGMAEDMAAEIYNVYLRNRGLAPTMISNDGLAESAFAFGPEDARDNRDQTIDRIEHHTRSQLEDVLAGDTNTVVLGGYRSGVGWERGYTETTALIVSATVQNMGHKVVCVIEGDHPIRSGDPNKIQNTRVVRYLTYNAAMELFDYHAGADGGAVQAPSLNIGKRNDIPLVVCNPIEENLAENSTLIGNAPTEPNGIEIVATKSIPTSILIRSEEMLGPGFIAKIVPWFAERNISIDLTPPSAVTYTITFGNDVLNTDIVPNFDGVLDDFETFLDEKFRDISIERFTDDTLIYCIGNNLSGIGENTRASLAITLAGAPVNIVSISRGDNAMIYGINREDATRAVQRVHDMCVIDGKLPLLDAHNKYAAV